MIAEAVSRPSISVVCLFLLLNHSETLYTRQAIDIYQASRHTDIQQQACRQAHKQSDRHKSNIARRFTVLQHIADSGIVGLGLVVGSQSQCRQCVGGQISGKQTDRQHTDSRQTYILTIQTGRQTGR